MSRSHSNTIQMIFLHLIHLAVLVFVLQSGHSNHERYGFTFTLFVLFSPFLNIFSELANHSRESMQQSRLLSCLFSTLFSKWCHDFKQRRRHFSEIFPIFYESRLFPFFTMAGYFTSETIMALSNGNITTFFIQKQGTNETQHIYFGGRRKTTLGTQHNITV